MRLKPGTSFVGQKFGRLKISMDAPPYRSKLGTSPHRRVEAVCDCGVVGTYFLNKLRRGFTQSCGCLKDETARRLLRDRTSRKYPAQSWTVVGEDAVAVIGGRHVWISSIDVDRVRTVRWHISRWGYALNSARVGMHRLLLNLAYLDGMVVDHIDHDGLNNRRSNLRIATRQQNNWNLRKATGAGNKWRGYYRTRHGKYHASISVNGQTTRLGSFSDEESAARAYDLAATRLHGEFASLNFPQSR